MRTAAAIWKAHFDFRYLSDVAVPHQFARPMEVVSRTLLTARLPYDPGLVHGVAHGPTLADAPRQRLLGVNVQPGTRCSDGRRCVPVIGRRNGYGVQLLALQQLP